MANHPAANAVIVQSSSATSPPVATQQDEVFLRLSVELSSGLQAIRGMPVGSAPEDIFFSADHDPLLALRAEGDRHWWHVFFGGCINRRGPASPAAPPNSPSSMGYTWWDNAWPTNIIEVFANREKDREGKLMRWIPARLVGAPASRRPTTGHWSQVNNVWFPPPTNTYPEPNARTAGLYTPDMLLRIASGVEGRCKCVALVDGDAQWPMLLDIRDAVNPAAAEINAEDLADPPVLHGECPWRVPPEADRAAVKAKWERRAARWQRKIDKRDKRLGQMGSDEETAEFIVRKTDIEVSAVALHIKSLKHETAAAELLLAALKRRREEGRDDMDDLESEREQRAAERAAEDAADGAALFGENGDAVQENGHDLSSSSSTSSNSDHESRAEGRAEQAESDEEEEEEEEERGSRMLTPYMSKAAVRSTMSIKCRVQLGTHSSGSASSVN